MLQVAAEGVLVKCTAGSCSMSSGEVCATFNVKPGRVHCTDSGSRVSDEARCATFSSEVACPSKVLQ